MSARILAAALAASFLALPALAEIEVHDAYAITSRAGAPTGGAFMVIHNHGGPDDHLLSVSSPVAEMVQLHTHVMDADGVARMTAVPEGWAIPADGELVLQRGAEHVMFMGITQPFEDGTMIPLTLHFEVAGEVTIEVPVDLSRLGGEEGMDMDDHSEHGG
jgi:copper(I)-binding protein